MPAAAPIPTRQSAWIEVDREAIADNVRSVNSLLGPSTRYTAVVKANGYGHGLVAAAQAAITGGADALGVALLEEGAALRAAGVRSAILVLGASLPECADALVENDLAPMVSDPALIEALDLAAQRQDRVVRVHVKVDTGMGRVGAHPERIESLLDQARTRPQVRLDGLSTHIGWEDKARIDEQVNSFLSLANRVGTDDCARHAANSLVALQSSAGRMDMARLGLLTYGVLPQPLYQTEEPADLRPALSILARITQLRDADPGQTVSYGGTYTVDRPSRLAILPVGYADGYPRSLSNRGQVLIHGCRCPVRGAVCMDQIVVDVTECPDARLGSRAVLVGSDGRLTITINDLAHTAGAIPHEILAGLGPRLPRVSGPR